MKTLFTEEERGALKEARRANKPMKGDVVVSPYADRALKGGGKAPSEGKIVTISRGYAYIRFGVGGSLSDWELRYLKRVPHDTRRGLKRPVYVWEIVT